MKIKIIERTDPHRCCARCGIEPKDVRKYGTKCTHWGVTYDRHYWIDWKPASSAGESTLDM